MRATQEEYERNLQAALDAANADTAWMNEKLDGIVPDPNMTTWFADYNPPSLLEEEEALTDADDHERD